MLMARIDGLSTETGRLLGGRWAGMLRAEFQACQYLNSDEKDLLLRLLWPCSQLLSLAGRPGPAQTHSAQAHDLQLTAQSANRPANV